MEQQKVYRGEQNGAAKWIIADSQGSVLLAFPVMKYIHLFLWIDQQVFQIYVANLRDADWTLIKTFQMTENKNKQVENGFLGWHLANGV